MAPNVTNNGGTAIKFGRAKPAIVDAAITSMRMLNRAAAEALVAIDNVHACTDVTGFGLVGHAIEMARASRVTLNIRAADVPVFDGVLEMARKNQSGGMLANREHYGDAIDASPDLPDEWLDLLFDPQTSGGLLVALDQLQADLALQVLAAAGVSAARIGSAAPLGDKALVIR